MTSNDTTTTTPHPPRPMSLPITGTFDRKGLSRLGWPVAWQGTVPTDERERQEAERRELVAQALEALDTVPDAVAAEFRNGVLVAIVCEPCLPSERSR